MVKKIPWTEAENFKECPEVFQSEKEQETESEEESRLGSTESWFLCLRTTGCC